MDERDRGEKKLNQKSISTRFCGFSIESNIFAFLFFSSRLEKVRLRKAVVLHLPLFACDSTKNRDIRDVSATGKKMCVVAPQKDTSRGRDSEVRQRQAAVSVYHLAGVSTGACWLGTC